MSLLCSFLLCSFLKVFAALDVANAYFIFYYQRPLPMESTLLKDLHGKKETWAITVKVIGKWKVHRKTPPFAPWKLSLMLLDAEVCIVFIVSF